MTDQGQRTGIASRVGSHLQSFVTLSLYESIAALLAFFGWIDTCVLWGELRARRPGQEAAVEPLPASATCTGALGPLMVAERRVQCLSALRLMLCPQVFTENARGPVLELPTHRCVPSSLISMPVRAPARRITCLHSSLVPTLCRWISLASWEIIHCSLPWCERGGSACQAGAVLHVVHPSCWVDLREKMPMNIARRQPQAWIWVKTGVESDPVCNLFRSRH